MTTNLKTTHTIQGVTKTFASPVTRAYAKKMLGKTKQPRAKLSPFHIQTFKNGKLPPQLTAPLQDSLPLFNKTILEVRAKYPRV